MVAMLGLALLSGLGLARAALNLDGTHAVEPAIHRDDPSPIDSPNTYYQEQHACPLPCSDYANSHSWITYTSATRVDRCDAPMLLQFSVSQSLRDSPYALIRSCTVDAASTSAARLANTTSPLGEPYASDMENPKLSEELYTIGVNDAPACAAEGLEVSRDLVVASSPGISAAGSRDDVSHLLRSMQKFFDDENNCDERFLFAKYKKTVASIYIGAGLGKPTTASVLDAFAKQITRDQGPLSNRTTVELCGGERTSTTTVGVSIDNTGDLAAVQATAFGWSQGKCAEETDDDLRSGGRLSKVKIFDIAGVDLASNATVKSFHSRFRKRDLLRKRDNEDLRMRATCDYLRVESGDGCPSLAAKCGITPPSFMKINSAPNLCSSLRPGDYVCCSSGDPYKPPPSAQVPKPQPDGTCATFIIGMGDTCDSLSRRFGVGVADLERWNKGKTWAWTKCEDMLQGYSMCISPGKPALPPPQEGAQCGPMVPGTKPPSSDSTSLADLNPCPLKVCCSNWGFCGIFPAHCTKHEVEGGAPGAKPKDIQSTCVSNCGMSVVRESSLSPTFGRIGYYESWNLGRDCLWLKARDANTDGSYTHMHWGFLDIDPVTWKPVVTDPHKQWDGFKNLPDMKRVASIGGWAYSTEPATYDTLRRAIINNRELFATNLAEFAREEGLDGIDIDWEYPGAPDIEVNGQVIGKETDGADYLRFLASLRQKLGPDKIVAIAAPASYWYLKAFPIDRISKIVDYIVYMTYDLHGQWDAGNPNAFDSCDSGRCVRSHVNMTETWNALGMVTKAGVSAHKIFVGESSYGRSFKLADPKCWGPLCDFTGSRTESHATPGRCTKTGGYLALAEINEIIKRDGLNIEVFRDDSGSNSDVLIYDGNYVSFMTPWNKYIRRSQYTSATFAGTIDWAVDLQEFSELDASAPLEPTLNENGEICRSGTSYQENAGDLCEFACWYGYCPEAICRCESWGEQRPFPRREAQVKEVVAIDEFDMDMNRLCRFTCQFHHCPSDLCTQPTKELPDLEQVEAEERALQWNWYKGRDGNGVPCQVYKNADLTDLTPCKEACREINEEDRAAGRNTNYGCQPWIYDNYEIRWYPGFEDGELKTNGVCECNNAVISFIGEKFMEYMPIIAQVGCYIFMSTFKLVLDVGLSLFTGGAGRAISAGMDMMATGAQVISHFYEEGEDPVGAFQWWLWPCGGEDLVPDDLKRVFDILNMVTDGISFKTPRGRRGSGKKGDDGNPPADRRPPRNTNNNPNAPPKSPNRCNIPAKQQKYLVSGNTLREQKCQGQMTMRTQYVISTLTYAPNAQPTQVRATCSKQHSQACFHYSSVIRNNPSWSTLTCPPEAATTAYRLDAVATDRWSQQRRGRHWLDPGFQEWYQMNPDKHECQRDEFPPAYLLNRQSVAWINSGRDAPGGQLVRFLPNTHNSGGGEMWKGACFSSQLKKMSVAEFERLYKRDQSSFQSSRLRRDLLQITYQGSATVNERPEFVIVEWGHAANPPREAGLRENPCWPDHAGNHPGFVLLDWDPYNKAFQPRNGGYNYLQPAF